MVCRPGATSRIFGIELTVIEAVATSPCTPPAILLLMFGEPRSRPRRTTPGAEIRLHVERDHRLPLR
jgi:hypothetical protein